MESLLRRGALKYPFEPVNLLPSFIVSRCASLCLDVQVVRLLDAEGSNSIASVRWSNKGNHLAVGFSSGGVQVWDVAASRKVRSYVCVDRISFLLLLLLIWKDVPTGE